MQLSFDKCLQLGAICKKTQKDPNLISSL